jgi:hypothetical protein
MLNLVQHLTRSKAYETLNPANGGIQGGKLGLFTRPSIMN